ncbi:NnrU family protein [Kineobactrum salinum]|uniref:NnrU family protein n=1 Tax=Kineobactrum salinum TaxID=2708301 RepID=A0A6C0U9Z4_9GAMM|nr:NnrU family protein [Kineobactrum salinum]QIB66554.1 NnrU family protein [Kineobactrum salinum]
MTFTLDSNVQLLGGWWQPVLALTLFVLSHRWLARPVFRAALVQRLGERGFTALYSLLSLVLLAWLIAATLAAPVVVLWYYAPWQPWVTVVTMLPVCLLIAAAVGTPNPLSFGGAGNERFLPSAPGAAGFCRHPLLLALALWAGAHVVPNGELATLLLFLPLAAFSIYGMRLVDSSRKAALGRAHWQALAVNTSLVPGAAMVTGRWRPAWGSVPWGRLLLGLIAYAAILLIHPVVIGVSALPMGLFATFN